MLNIIKSYCIILIILGNLYNKFIYTIMVVRAKFIQYFDIAVWPNSPMRQRFGGKEIRHRSLG